MFLDEMGLSYFYGASRGYLCVFRRNMSMGYNELVVSALEARAIIWFHSAIVWVDLLCCSGCGCSLRLCIILLVLEGSWSVRWGR